MLATFHVRQEWGINSLWKFSAESVERRVGVSLTFSSGCAPRNLLAILRAVIYTNKLLQLWKLF